MLQNIKDVLGPEVYDVIMTRIAEDYLDPEMDIRTAVMQRPDIFEGALVELLGQMGEILLVKMCQDIGLDDSLHYSRPGDLAKCMAMMAKA